MESVEQQVDRDELLYRRISPNANPPWVNLEEDPAVKQRAFLPHKTNDLDGLSLIRAKYRSAEEAAHNPRQPDVSCFLAVVRAGDLMNIGLTIEPSPDAVDKEQDGPAAHVLVKEMNSATCRDSQVKDWARQIAEKLVKEVKRPGPSPDSD